MSQHLLDRILQEDHHPDDHSNETEYYNQTDYYDHDGMNNTENHYHDDLSSSSSSSTSSSSKPWGDVLAATFIVNLTTFTAVLVLFMLSVTKRVWGKELNDTMIHKFHGIMIPSFACGALLATAFLFVIPEAMSNIMNGGGDGHEDDVTSHSSSSTTVEEEHDEEEHYRYYHYQRYLNEHEATGHEGHKEQSWKFGVSVMAGFLLPIVLSVFFHHHHDNNDDCHHDHSHDIVVPETTTATVATHHPPPHPPPVSSTTSDLEFNNTIQSSLEKQEGQEGQEKDSKKKKKCCSYDDSITPVDVVVGEKIDTKEDDNNNHDVVLPTPTKKKPINYTLLGSLVLGDLLHLFCDGIFIGTAFLACGRTFAYTMVVSTIYHELCHQLSDFALMVHNCHLSILQAMIWNFLSGTSVMIGGVLALSINFSSRAIGIILAASAGLFIQIAACECIPRFQKHRQISSDMILFSISFLVGAVPIGLVLLNHNHCEEG
jgi:zinc transporter ZupT